MKKDEFKNLIRECISEVLTESMTLTVSDAPQRQFENMINVASFLGYKGLQPVWDDMSEFERARFQKERAPETFTPDGDDWKNELEGVINFYVRGLSKDRIKDVLRNINAALTEKKFGFQWPPKADKSGRWESDVYRIFITKNPDAVSDVEDVPEINLSNANMRVVLSALGYEMDSYDGLKTEDGYINTMDLLSRINSLEKESLGKHVRPSYDSDMEKFRNPGQDRKGPHMMDSGLDEHGIMERISRIKQLAQWALKRKYMRLSIM